MRRTVYMATTHSYGEAIETPPRHRANPADAGGADWQIHESKYSDQGVRLIWACDVFEHLAKPPSKFHPNAGKKKPAKKSKPKPKPAPSPAMQAVLEGPKPAPKPKAPKPPKEKAGPKLAAPEARVGER